MAGRAFLCSCGPSIVPHKHDSLMPLILSTPTRQAQLREDKIQAGFISWAFDNNTVNIFGLF